MFLFFYKQKTAYEMRISDWSSDVCSSDLYDCLKCPGYCCSYPNIHTKPEDIKRLAKHFGIDAEKAEKRFTKKGFKEEGMETRPRVLRHQDDEHFGSIGSEEHTSELQSLMRISYAVFCLKKKNTHN